MKNCQVATNIAEILIDDTTEKILTINGFSTIGSDYDRFKRLCVCVDKMPEHPASRHFQAQLETLFSCPYPLGSLYCKEIWKQTSQRLLSSERCVDVEDETTKISVEILPPYAGAGVPKPLFLINGMQIEAESWKDWQSCAEQMVESAVQAEKCLTIEFSSDFCFEKPNLYRVERHLKGIERNNDMWGAQLLYFLCRFCFQRELRCLIDWRSDCKELLNILQYVSNLTSIPNIFLKCSQIDSAVLTEISERIMKFRKTPTEGIPPILLLAD